MGCEGGFAYVMLERSASRIRQIERAGADNGQLGVPRRQIKQAGADSFQKDQLAPAADAQPGAALRNCLGTFDHWISAR